MLRKKSSSSPALRESIQAKDAVFMGWQKTALDEVFALYNITAADHPSLGSTVTEQGLRMLNLRVPWTPLPQGSVKKF
jgi:hypothetical protein